ncbi:hypothetical protein ACO0SA_001240 [Hanseniaspora valbyensis]
MSSFLKLFDSKPTLNRASTTSDLDDRKKKESNQIKNIKSKSQTNVVNGIYRTVKPSRSRTPVEKYNDSSNILRTYKSSDNKMFVSPTQSNKSDFIGSADGNDDIINVNSVDDIMIKSNNVNNDVVFYRRFSSSEDEIELKNKIGGQPYAEVDDCEENFDATDGETDESVLIDILPSFQFFDSLVKFLPEDNKNDDDVPSLHTENESNNISFTERTDSNSSFNPPSYYPGSAVSPINRQLQSPPLPPSFASNSSSELRYEVDKFYKLPHKTTNNIDIKIVLTKNPVEPNTLSEKENLLREFSSGELINGYVTVLNRSSAPIKFEGFYVSFEGDINLQNRDTKRTTTMRFLKTHDLSASWSYAQVELASGVNYDATILDETDNTRLGLPNSKMLKPKVKYKKYFCFKVPNEILDTNCKHQIHQHLSLPPSYGLNRYKLENLFIEMNNVLGYGHTGLKGSAILCADLASYDDYVSSYLKRNIKGHKASSKLKQGFTNEGSNINYSISCKLIMKQEKTLQPYVLNDTIYNIRIIPNTLSSNSKYRYSDGKSSLVNLKQTKKTLFKLTDKTIKRIDQLETLLQKLEHWEDNSIFSKDDLTIQLQDIVEKKQELEQNDAKLSWDELKKNRNPSTTNNNNNNGILGNDGSNEFETLIYKDTYKTILRTNGDIKKQSTASLEKINTFFGGSNSNISGSSHNGTFSPSTTVNQWIQLLLKLSQNKKETKNKTDRKVWDKEFTNNNNYRKHNGHIPKLKNVKTYLQSFTAYSQRSMPIVFDANFVQTQRKFIDQIIFNSKESVKKIEKLKKNYMKYQERLNTLAKELGVDERSVKFESFISNSLSSDLEALASLNIERFVMSNVFKPTVIPPADLLNWVKVSNDEIKCELEINLNYRDDLMMTILPTFDTCLISRFYSLEIECEFSTGDKVVLNIPVDNNLKKNQKNLSNKATVITTEKKLKSNLQKHCNNGIYKTINSRKSKSNSDVSLEENLNQDNSIKEVITPLLNISNADNNFAYDKTLHFVKKQENKFKKVDSNMETEQDDDETHNDSDDDEDASSATITESQSLTSLPNEIDLPVKTGCRYEVDKIHEFPHRRVNNLDIKVVLTKDAVLPNTPSEPQNLLREYSSGEFLNGYITKPIKFEGFYVSLEGSINVKNRETKQVTKKFFLKMHDLSATWSYGNVELSSGVAYSCAAIDSGDGSQLGLPNSKVLDPKTKYKKYFCFKIPKKILDNNCKHQHASHLAIPPSFGINRNKYENSFIDINDLLGYGHLGFRGSPVLTPDLASYDKYVSSALKKNTSGILSGSKLKCGFTNEGSFINYEISCRLVMKEKSIKPYVLNDTSYNLRIIPNTLSSNEKYKYSDNKSSIIDVNSLKKQLSTIYDQAIRCTDQLETLLQKCEHWDDLILFNKEDLMFNSYNLGEKKQSDAQSCKTLVTTIETSFNKDLKVLPYHRSNYLALQNKIEGKNKTDKKVWCKEIVSQLPTTVSDYELTSLPLTITVDNINGDTDIPKIKKITTKLFSYTTYTERSCPILLDANFLIKEPHFLEQIVINCKERLKHISNLKKIYMKHEEKLKLLAMKLNVPQNLIRFESFIGSELYSNLEALSTLNVEKFEMNNVFEPTDLSQLNSQKWEKISPNKSKCEVNVNLKYKERLFLTILPSFDSCLMSRFYHLEVQCEFTNGEKSILKIPIDVKYFKD